MLSSPDGKEATPRGPCAREPQKSHWVGTKAIAKASIMLAEFGEAIEFSYQESAPLLSKGFGTVDLAIRT